MMNRNRQIRGRVYGKGENVFKIIMMKPPAEDGLLSDHEVLEASNE